MDIKVTITAVLEDKGWGFSELLNGRELNDESRAEIEELIAQDPYSVMERGLWKIDIA